jgi:hypothetical protein
MDKVKFEKTCDETAASFMNEFHNIVGGTFERRRWDGMLAKYFKDSLGPFLVREPKAAEEPKPKAEEKIGKKEDNRAGYWKKKTKA